MSYDTGDSFTMTVTGVDDIPETDGSAPYDENPSSSVYTFEAETSEQHDIAVGSWLSLSLQEAADTSTFYLPLQYVRKENGQYYVFGANALFDIFSVRETKTVSFGNTALDFDFRTVPNFSGLNPLFF